MNKRPTIDELEKALSPIEPENIEINPDGTVVHLTEHEIAQKELRLTRETVEVLRNKAVKLRDGLQKIVKELEDLLP